MKKNYTFRIDPSVDKNLTQLAKKKGTSKSALCNEILKAHLSSQSDVDNNLFLENLSIILPDLRSQKEEMYQLKKTINNLIAQSEEAYDHISDMKRGEGFYFKTIYSELKEQKEALSKYVTTTDKPTAPPKRPNIDDIYKKLRDNR
ncbi:hypothetical protein HOH45_08865 [bacterium]|jgi:predicted HicB family RNase H-like nuclease|nr:hypothetical protein [bacterium]